MVSSYTRLINDNEGVVTWAVPVEASDQIPAPFLRQLSQINGR